MPEEPIDVPELNLVAAALKERFGDSIPETVYAKKELSFMVRTPDLPAVLEYLKAEHGFNALNDMIGLHHPAAPGGPPARFAVLYQLYRFPGAVRVRVVAEVGEGETLPSVTSLYPSACWAEREIFDMFGIRFAGHPDLRRIYLPDEFEGHPLRKDFPLEG
jgi:NADH-quinone oxidoreductase subunit C